MHINIFMLTKLKYTVPLELLEEANSNLPVDNFKVSINEPTGDFFYDPWIVKPEFKNTVWGRIMQTLPIEVGEARIINLTYGTCYQSHGDIDDRYHLNINSHYAYLVNLEAEKMYPLSTDGVWYEMDAGPRHSAVNFGYTKRTQLVVRKLLDKNSLTDPVHIKIFYAGSKPESARFVFDDVLSPWLNRANKKKVITSFEHNQTHAKLKIEKTSLTELQSLLPVGFQIEEL